MRSSTFWSVIITMVLLEIILLFFIRQSSNPFTQTQITGKVVSVAPQGSILLVNGRMVLLRLGERFVGQPPALGCTAQIRGAYASGLQTEPPTFVATLAVAQDCSHTSRGVSLLS
jgi:hypothetical protein